MTAIAALTLGSIGIVAEKGRARPRDRGAFICFEEQQPGAEAAGGTQLGPTRRLAHRAVRGVGCGRVSIAGVACYRPGDRPHLFCMLRAYHRRNGEARPRGSPGRTTGT